MTITMSFFDELKRRNVFRVGIAYIIVAWLVMQVSDVVLNNITAPGWVFKVLMLFLAIGLPIAVIFAWAFEMTPDGLKLEREVDRSQSITQHTSRKLDYTIIGVLVFALGYLAFDKFVLSADRDAALVEATTQSVAQQVASDSAAATETDKSIAVLPFVNLSSDPEQEFFSDGISEELLNVLAQFPGLRVAARTSSFQFKGQNVDIAKIAETLNVAHILEGSVRKSANKLRITAQLIKAEDGFHLWSKTYDRELTDIFAIQDEISAAIGDALKVQLALDDGSTSIKRPMVIEAANTQAYEAYLRGRQLINRRGRDNLENAVRSLEKSLRLDSEYAPAHAQLAIATALLLRSPQSYGDLTMGEVLSQATPHVQKALTLAPDLAEAHGALALLALDQFDYPTVLEHTRRALQLNPSYIDALNWQYLAVSGLGDYQEMEVVMQRLLKADPLTIIGRLNYINLLGAKGSIDEAHAVSDALLAQYPWAGYVSHGLTAQAFEGDIATGLKWFLQAFAADPTDTFSNRSLVLSFSFVGLYDEARRVDDDLVFMPNAAEGLEQAAMEQARQRMEQDTTSPTTILDYADTLHRAGYIAEAQPLYEGLLAKQAGQPVRDQLDNSPAPTIRLALGRKQAGDEDAFMLVAQMISRDIAAIAAANFGDQYSSRSAAMLAAIQGDSASALESIRNAIKLGLRDPGFFGEPAFADLQSDPKFEALRTEVNDMLQVERQKILQMICHDNPVPESWQPLAATCAGV